MRFNVVFGVLGMVALVSADVARPVRVSGRSLLKRDAMATCSSGTMCGEGCTDGECCDSTQGFSCDPGETCSQVNGQVACCPEGKSCNTISKCLDADSTSCVNGDGTEDTTCCESDAPYCNFDADPPRCQPSPVGLASGSGSSIASSTAVSSAFSMETGSASGMTYSSQFLAAATGATSSGAYPNATSDDIVTITITSTSKVPCKTSSSSCSAGASGSAPTSLLAQNEVTGWNVTSASIPLMTGSAPLETALPVTESSPAEPSVAWFTDEITITSCACTENQTSTAVPLGGVDAASSVLTSLPEVTSATYAPAISEPMSLEQSEPSSTQVAASETSPDYASTSVPGVETIDVTETTTSSCSTTSSTIAAIETPAAVTSSYAEPSYASSAPIGDFAPSSSASEQSAYETVESWGNTYSSSYPIATGTGTSEEISSTYDWNSTAVPTSMPGTGTAVPLEGSATTLTFTSTQPCGCESDGTALPLATGGMYGNGTSNSTALNGGNVTVQATSVAGESMFTGAAMKPEAGTTVVFGGVLAMLGAILAI